MAIRELHVPDPDGEWTCERGDCKRCEDGDNHRGVVCSYCTNDDVDFGWIVQWPCPTMQIIEDLPAPGLRVVR